MFGNKHPLCENKVIKVIATPITRLEIRKTGYLGDLYGIPVRTSYLMTQGNVIAVSEPNLTGVISVRIDQRGLRMTEMSLKTFNYMLEHPKGLLPERLKTKVYRIISRKDFKSKYPQRLYVRHRNVMI